MKNVLITGASGFIGRNLILNCDPNWKIYATYCQSKDFLNFIKSNNLENVIPYKIDLTLEFEVKNLSERTNFDIGIFLASNTDPAISVADPKFDLESNVQSLINTLLYYSFEKFVYFSSGAVYDGIEGKVSPSTPINPVLPYAISKYACERYASFFLKKGKINSLNIVRFFGAYGLYEPSRKIYGKLVKQFAIDRNPNFLIRGDGKNLIDAMHIEDAIHAILQIVSSNNLPEVVDLASQNPVSIRSLVETAAETFGIVPEITYQENVPEYINFLTIDDSMKKHLNFSPIVSLREGLMRFKNQLIKYS